MSEAVDRRARIAAIGKAFRVLELFGPESPELRITDIASRADMSRSSAQRLVHTLVKCGWMHRDASATVLSLGHRAVDPAFVYLSSSQLMDLVMPFVVELNARTALSCDLWLRDGAGLVTLARIPSPASSLALAPVGSRAGLADSAPGRAILSCLSPSGLEEVLNDLGAGAGAGHDRKGLLEQIAQAHKAAHAIGDDLSPGSGKVLAAAFIGADGEPAGALSVAGFRDGAGNAGVVELLCETIASINGLRVAPAAASTIFYPGSHVVWPLPDAEDDPLEIASVTKALYLLQFFHSGAPRLTLTELAKKTGFPVPTAQRIIDTLVDLGYLARDDRRRAYSVSVRSLDLLYRFQMSQDLLRSVWPRLIRFREECRLRCSFCILDGTEIVHLLHVQSRPGPDYRTAHAGRRFLAASSSGGRAMLSWLPEDEVRQILQASEIDALTGQTVTDREAIFADIQCASARGVAFTDRQSVRDEVNVAAAIRGPDGRPLGAIVVSAPARTWTIERLEKEVVPSLLSHSRSGGLY